MMLVDKIIAILVPLTGEIMARSSIKLYCEKLGYAPESLTRAQLWPLSEQISKSLALFVGTEKAADVGNRIASLE